MKKIILALVMAFSIASCKKNDVQLNGSLEVKMSYYYNSYQGYKPDVGAKIYLFKQTGKSYERKLVDYRIGLLTIEGTTEIVRADFKAEADGTGLAKIQNVPYGDYLLVASSKGRFIYSTKPITINAALQNEVKNFGYLNEFKDEGESW